MCYKVDYVVCHRGTSSLVCDILYSCIFLLRLAMMCSRYLHINFCQTFIVFDILLPLLLKDEDPLICAPCNSLLTVEHISCVDFDIIRQNLYTASTLNDFP